MAGFNFINQARSYLGKLSEMLSSDVGSDVVGLKQRSQISADKILFVDLEIGDDNKIYDIGATDLYSLVFHSSVRGEFDKVAADYDFFCGHNIIRHDLVFLYGSALKCGKRVIDTLFWSPLLFPKKPYHKLLKDEKLISDQFNNPYNDSLKAKELLLEETMAFDNLPDMMKKIYYSLLSDVLEYKYFFEYIDYEKRCVDVAGEIKSYFSGKICDNADVARMVINNPVELAFSLAIINADDSSSITPAWVRRAYPEVENVMERLKNTQCESLCEYCASAFDINKGLKDFFGYDAFRKFDGEPMQENAVRAAVSGGSLLTIFPTGGGKSLTFQLPALMAAKTVSGLTVVISPLQSLMKDQVDNLEQKGIGGAVTINGLLDPISRAEAIEQVSNGLASILYISPESLRSKTIEKLILSRNVVRFVIDEAHCFSAWGQDFRVDYLYIGDFIRKVQEAKKKVEPIPVSCFTATAKQKVISDIKDYFKTKLGLELELFATKADRTNLSYSVLHCETDADKYNRLRELIDANNCPTIVYVSRTKRTKELASKLTRDGILSLPYNGKMESVDKIKNQDAFKRNAVRCIVATSAFGMGVDKQDVGLVVHYDISDSLENYVQEAGRAGRDQSIMAKCYVLFCDGDLDKHFILLNQTKLSLSEIQQIWMAIKRMTEKRKRICCSSLEIARFAGWDDSVAEIETRVKTALLTLENAGYISRGYNVPHIYATGILAKNIDEVRVKIEKSNAFNEEIEKKNAIRIVRSLLSSKSRSLDGEAESRVDYLADILGLKKEAVINAINLMRQSGILADSRDMSAYISAGETLQKSVKTFEQMVRIERFLLNRISYEVEEEFTYKQLNSEMIAENLNTSVQSIKNILHFLYIKGYIGRMYNAGKDGVSVVLKFDKEKLMQKHEQRCAICSYILDKLFSLPLNKDDKDKEERFVQFSLIEMLNGYNKSLSSDVFSGNRKAEIVDVEESLLYLSKIKSLRIEGGFLVIYNAMDIRKLVENKFQYKREDYKSLNEFYKHKIQQIHIVGEYANLMTKDYDMALRFVKDYFMLDFKQFISKYFKADRAKQIEMNITPSRYQKLFGKLSATQKLIINDTESKHIVVAAGPGSGKTMVLVHKLASLLLMEDVKHEQLLMLTFSRAAAFEFKKRLIDLVGNAAYFVEIKTFHSYCFDLLGQLGNLDDAKNVVQQATNKIIAGEVEQGRINKTVLVIDEAQDMSADDFALVEALMQHNENMRVIAVGDDDQNIFQFRDADSKNMISLISKYGAKKYELVENFRSASNVVNFANVFVDTLTERLKSEQVISVSPESGTVSVTYHIDTNIEIPLVNDLLKERRNGSTCILTRSNEEAMLINGLLKRKKINSKLIQSTDDFRFYNLAEVRYFLKKIDELSKNRIVVCNEAWTEAISALKSAYSNSRLLPYMEVAINNFEQINKQIYRNDLHEYFYESGMEDFFSENNDVVVVSTMHKSKGREYDNVYVLLNKELTTDEERRLMYVAITRAKKRLVIHAKKNIFPGFMSINNVIFKKDKAEYPELSEMAIQLGYKDVYLSFFDGRKKQVLSVRSGDTLTYKNEIFP